MLDAIREIVKTYNLPSRINSLVLRIADRNIQRLGLTSFSDQYRYVAELVDKFQVSREDRNAVSLDSPIKGDGRTWHDVLFYSKNPYEDEEDGLTLGRSVDISDKFLGDRHREVIHKLLEESNPQNIIDLTSDEIFADFFGINLRLEAVAKYLARGGRIYPERRIVHVNLDSENPFIRWGTRQGAYNKNPLAYFRRHQDVYGEMGRFDLFKFDCGLYMTLKRRKVNLDDGSVVTQLQLAIPNKKPTGLHAPIRRRFNGDKIKDYKVNAPETVSKKVGFILGVGELESAVDIGQRLLQEGNLSEENIVGSVVSAGNVEISDLLGRSRKPRIASLRQVAGFLLRKQCGLSYPQIARKLNREDHTTVLYGCRKIEHVLARKKVD